MLSELLQTVLVDILEHAGGASRQFPALAQAFRLALAVGLGLAQHVVVIVGFAAGADEEAGAEEGSGGGADFGDFGDGVRVGGGVDENLLVETVDWREVVRTGTSCMVAGMEAPKC